MIRYIEKGDIFRIDGVSSYAHGCNCAGAMGKGIAVQFKSKYPDMYLEYKQLCKENKFCPGDVFDYDYGNGHIYNLGTQATWRTRAKIEYIEKALIQMLELASGDNVTAIALPAIGAGLGGLKWDDVKAVLNKVSNDYPNVDCLGDRAICQPDRLILYQRRRCQSRSQRTIMAERLLYADLGDGLDAAVCL